MDFSLIIKESFLNIVYDFSGVANYASARGPCQELPGFLGLLCIEQHIATPLYDFILVFCLFKYLLCITVK